MMLDDRALELGLHAEAELIADREIESAIHDPEAVRRADHGVGGVIEVVALDDGDVLDLGEHRAPRAGEPSIARDQRDLHGVYHTL